MRIGIYRRRFTFVWNPPYRFYELVLWRWRPARPGSEIYTRRITLTLDRGKLHIVLGDA